jgi:hypothetical protein
VIVNADTRLDLCNYCVYICLILFITVYFSLQVENKPHDGVTNCAFILEVGVVINTIQYV